MKTIFLRIKDFTDGLSRKNIDAHAAASAFYMFLSLVPFVALITTILPYTGLEEERLFDIVSHYIPSAMQELISSTVMDIYSASNLVLPLAIITTIWLASRAFSSLIRGIEVISGAAEYSSFFKRSLRACIYTITLIIIMVLLLLLLVFGNTLSKLPIISPFVRFLIKLRIIVVIVVITLVFIAIYHWVPGMRLRLRDLLPGSLIAAGVWLLFTWLFSLYILYGVNYSAYGNLASIVITLLWMYWCMYIVLLGAYTNMYIYRRRHADD